MPGRTSDARPPSHNGEPCIVRPIRPTPGMTLACRGPAIDRSTTGPPARAETAYAANRPELTSSWPLPPVVLTSVESPVPGDAAELPGAETEAGSATDGTPPTDDGPVIIEAGPLADGDPPAKAIDAAPVACSASATLRLIGRAAGSGGRATGGAVVGGAVVGEVVIDAVVGDEAGNGAVDDDARLVGARAAGASPVDAWAGRVTEADVGVAADGPAATVGGGVVTAPCGVVGTAGPDIPTGTRADADALEVTGDDATGCAAR